MIFRIDAPYGCISLFIKVEQFKFGETGLILGFHVTSEKTKIKNFKFLP